jgi:hypothetical protein
LDELALEFQVRTPEDWVFVRLIDVERNGGAGLLSFYGRSLQKGTKKDIASLIYSQALSAAYPELNWRSLFQKKRIFASQRRTNIDTSKGYLESLTDVSPQIDVFSSISQRVYLKGNATELMPLLLEHQEPTEV